MTTTVTKLDEHRSINAVVERFFGTLKKELSLLRLKQSLDDR